MYKNCQLPSVTCSDINPHHQQQNFHIKLKHLWTLQNKLEKAYTKNNNHIKRLYNWFVPQCMHAIFYNAGNQNALQHQSSFSSFTITQTIMIPRNTHALTREWIIYTYNNKKIKIKNLTGPKFHSSCTVYYTLWKSQITHWLWKFRIGYFMINPLISTTNAHCLVNHQGSHESVRENMHAENVSHTIKHCWTTIVWCITAEINS